MGASNAQRKSTTHLRLAFKSARQATNQTWNAAYKAPMFKKAVPKKGFQRTNRLIGSQAYAVAASGAAAAAFAVARREAAELRVPVGIESKRCPVLPSLSIGARSMLESFLTAYVQEAALKAVAIRDCEPGPETRRVTSGMLKAAFEFTNAQLDAAAAAPRFVAVSSEKKPAEKREEEKEEGKEGEKAK